MAHLQENLRLARLTVDYVRKAVMRTGASNRVEDLIKSTLMTGRVAASGHDVTLMRQMRGSGGFGSVPSSATFGKDYYPTLRQIAHAAKRMGAGNCGEHAAVAFVYLHEAWRIKPLDYMTYERPGDHAFVVIGRDGRSQPSDYHNWGQEAVVCDPWDEKAFPASRVTAELYGIQDGHRIGTACRLE